MSLKNSFETFRQPEYVGENRCLACTAVNLTIASIASGGIAVSAAATGRSTAASLSVGALVLVTCVAIVYLRGYLIPGTPTMTKRYMPAWMLRLFGKAPEPTRGDSGAIDVEAVLLEAGALEECGDSDDLCLTPSFEIAWNDRIETLAGVDPKIDGLLDRGDLDTGADRSDVVFEERSDGYVARTDDTLLAGWPSRAAFLADSAAAAELRERSHNWPAMTFPERIELAGSLRLWLDRCPTCDGRVEMGEEVVESCCRERHVLASNCEACGSRLFEADVAPDALESD